MSILADSAQFIGQRPRSCFPTVEARLTNYLTGIRCRLGARGENTAQGLTGWLGWDAWVSVPGHGGSDAPSPRGKTYTKPCIRRISPS